MYIYKYIYICVYVYIYKIGNTLCIFYIKKEFEHLKIKNKLFDTVNCIRARDSIIMLS